MAGAPGDAVIAQLIGDLIASSVGEWQGRRLIGRKRAKAAVRGLFVCGLRVVSGSQPGLSVEWLVGEWSIQPGQLSMDAVVVPIVETVAGTHRPARLNEIVGGDDTIIVTVRTGAAVLEWSMLRQFDGLVLRALGVPESSH